MDQILNHFVGAVMLKNMNPLFLFLLPLLCTGEPFLGSCGTGKLLLQCLIAVSTWFPSLTLFQEARSETLLQLLAAGYQDIQSLTCSCCTKSASATHSQSLLTHTMSSRDHISLSLSLSTHTQKQITCLLYF